MNQRPSGYELRFVCGGETFRLVSGPAGSGKPHSEALSVPLVPWILIPIWVRVWVKIILITRYKLVLVDICSTTYAVTNKEIYEPVQNIFPSFFKPFAVSKQFYQVRTSHVVKFNKYSSNKKVIKIIISKTA